MLKKGTTNVRVYNSNMEREILKSFPFLSKKNIIRSLVDFTLMLQLAEINKNSWFSFTITKFMGNPLMLKETKRKLLFQMRYLSEFSSKLFDEEYFRAVESLISNMQEKDYQEKFIEEANKNLTYPVVRIESSEKFPDVPKGNVVLALPSKFINLQPFLTSIGNRIYYLCSIKAGRIFYCNKEVKRECRRKDEKQGISQFLMKNFLIQGTEKIIGENEVKTLKEALNLYNINRIEEAASVFEIVRGKYGDFPALLYILGKIYRRMESKGDLERISRRMIELYPSLDRSFEVFSWYLEAVNSKPQLKATINRGLSLNPKNKNLKEKLKELDKGIKEGEEFLYLMNGIEYERIIGREREIEEIIEVLNCKYKNNVLIVGEDGVGKTALVEELVRRIDNEEIPEPFVHRKIYKLNFAKSIAGTKFRGQFEERVLELIKKVRETNGILFLDDLHFLLSPSFTKGAGLDIAGVLLPEMERGRLQIITTTSFAQIMELKENSPSFIRRFHTIRLEEIGDPLMRDILEKKKEVIEEHHGVIIPQRFLSNIMELSHLYLPEKKLPEMAIDIMDRASAKASIDFLRGWREIPEVTLSDLQEIVAEMSGLPEEEIKTSSRDTVLHLKEKLKGEIVGQDEAIEKISRVIRTAKLGMDIDSRRPDGVFLFIGPTGVGKTETARALARTLFGNEKRLIRIDMSQLMEKHSYSELVGAPPGYVGYYDQNQLTDRIISQPTSIVLLDEVEKAHSMVLNVFLQVFDAGRLTDGRGRTVYFNHSTIIMTSNLGTKLYSSSKIGFQWNKVEKSEIMQEIKNYFSPEFLNRLDEIVFFRPLGLEDVKKIIELQLREVRRRLKLEGKRLILSEKAKEKIAMSGYSMEYGARRLARTIREMVLDKLGEIKLSDEWGRIKTIYIDVKNDEIFIRTLEENVEVEDEDQIPLSLKMKQ